MRMGKWLFWLFFIIATIWETASFALAVINRSRSVDTCEQANPSSNATSPTSGNTTTNGFLGMNLGNTYGLANCSQAVQAGLIGIAVMLFAGTLFMVCMTRLSWNVTLFLIILTFLVLLCYRRFVLLHALKRTQSRSPSQGSFGLGWERHGSIGSISPGRTVSATLPNDTSRQEEEE